MKKKIKQLEDLAISTVGDGKNPNLFFVSENGVITTVTRDFNIAYNKWMDNRYDCINSVIEDRKNGMICEYCPFSKNNERICIDDSVNMGLRKP